MYTPRAILFIISVKRWEKSFCSYVKSGFSLPADFICVAALDFSVGLTGETDLDLTDDFVLAVIFG